MDLETTKQSKLSQREIKKLHNIAYMWNIKNIYIQMNLFAKQK